MDRQRLLGGWWFRAACVVALPLVAGAARGEVPPGESIARDEMFWQQLSAKLTSEEAAVREAGEKEIDEVPWQGRDGLERVLENAADVQVKAKLAARLEAIGEQLALDPPPISVALHDAKLSEVAAALRQATGVRMEVQGNDESARFDVSAKAQPFWDLFAALSAQHALNMQRNESLQIVQTEPGLLYPVAATGGFRVFPGKIERSRTSTLQAIEGDELGEEELSLRYVVAADPRTRIVGYQPPVLTAVTDDAGNDVLAAAARSTVRRTTPVAERGNVLYPGVARLHVVDNMGKKIATAMGEARFTVQITESVLLIEKPAEKLRQPLTVGSQTLLIEKFDVQEGVVNFEVTGRQGSAPATRRIVEPGSHMQILDKENDVVWETTVNGGAGGGAATGDHPLPFHLRFTVPDKTKEVVVKFELKDLPIP